MRSCDEIRRAMAAKGVVRYLSRVPKTVAPGLLVVHNHVRPARPLGMNGFRAWLANPQQETKVEVCDCGWAPHLAKHYRVKRRGHTGTTDDAGHNQTQEEVRRG